MLNYLSNQKSRHATGGAKQGAARQGAATQGKAARRGRARAAGRGEAGRSKARRGGAGRFMTVRCEAKAVRHWDDRPFPVSEHRKRSVPKEIQAFSPRTCVSTVEWFRKSSLEFRDMLNVRQNIVDEYCRSTVSPMKSGE